MGRGGKEWEKNAEEGTQKDRAGIGKEDSDADGDVDEEEDEESNLAKVALSEAMLKAMGGEGGENWQSAWEAEVEALSEEDKQAIKRVRALAGTPEVIEELIANQDRLSVPLIEAAFPFPLDDYQVQAVRTLLDDRSLVLSAPTGAGKTVAGEAAVYIALAKRKRVFYTTPLKALSNQKYLDLCRSLGAERVGLSTGDVRQNVDADIVVMTTEVYRNMLYAESSGARRREKEREQADKAGIASPGEEDAIDEGRLSLVDSVVLDEFHYMNDQDRGTVWEESVINAPNTTKLVALSATMANSEEVRSWIDLVHGQCNLVLSTNRPVPLRFGYCDRWGILPLFVNPKALRGRNFFTQEPIESEKRPSLMDGAVGFGDKKAKKARKGMKLNPEILSREQKKKREFLRNTDDPNGALRRFRRAQTPPMGLVVRELRKYRLLPGIIFIFSRRGCEDAAKDVVAHVDGLTNEKEKQEIAERLRAFEARSPGIVNPERQWMVREGVATHHAGLLPVWKSFVEELFQDGLLKVVFATETLAAGINMPARTTVISALARRRGEGVAMLTASELRQMAGRAGRRGKDSVGYSVILKSRFRGAQEAFTLVKKRPEALKSKFTPTYGMVLNLLSSVSVEEAKRSVANSFGSYLRAKRIAKRERRMEYQIALAREIVDGIDQDQFLAYNKLRHKLKAEKRALGYLIEQSREAIREYNADMLQWAPVGTPILIPGETPQGEDRGMDENAISALLLDDGGRTLPPYLVALGSDNRFYILPDTEIISVDFEHPVDIVDSEASDLLSGLRKPPWLAYNSEPPMYVEVSQNPKTKSWAHRIPKLDSPPIPPEVIAQQSRVEKILKEMEASPIHPLPHKNRIMKAFKFLRKANEEDTSSTRLDSGRGSEKDVGNSLGDNVENGVDNSSAEGVSQQGLRDSFLWNQFLNLTQVLNKYGFLEGMEATKDLGALGAAVKGDNELWISLALLELDNLFWDQGLEPQQLAAVIAALVSYEPSAGAGDLLPQNLRLSAESDDLISHLDLNVRAPLELQQENHNVKVPVNLETHYAGLVEAWALGENWMELSEGSDMQEGDLCNLLRRTLDVLRLIPRLPTLSRAFKRQARSAVKMVGRYPITDMVTYELQAEELTDQETVEDTFTIGEDSQAQIDAGSKGDAPPPRAMGMVEDVTFSSPTNSVSDSFDYDEASERRLSRAAGRGESGFEELIRIVESNSRGKRQDQPDEVDEYLEDEDDDEDDSLFGNDLDDDDDFDEDSYEANDQNDDEPDKSGNPGAFRSSFSDKRRRKSANDAVNELLNLLQDDEDESSPRKNDW